MTDIALISTCLETPALLKKEDPGRLQQLTEKYLYFAPAHYLRAVHSFSYEQSPLNTLMAQFPANRVLVYQLFIDKGVKKEQELFSEPAVPLGHQDYFATQGIKVQEDLPPKEATAAMPPLSKEKDLMVVMSFSEWLRYLEERTRKAKEEAAGKSALRAMWQKQKLSAAMEEEEEEIPENVFEMAVNSITPKEDIISESMAAVYALQGKKEKALEMYKKLSLRNPEKSAYFAKKIENLQKEIDI